VRFSLFVALAVLAACQPVPKPFSHGDAPPRDLLRLSDAPGIEVLPVTGRTGEPLDQVIAEMVRALQQQNVPATYGSANKSSYLLSGALSEPPAPPALVWTLRTQQGAEIGRVVQPWPGPPDTAKLAEPAGFTRAAAALAVLIQGASPREAAPPPVHVADVAGAPGDGNSRLRAAIEQVLPRTGLALVPRPGDDSLIVTGAVTVGPAHGGEQQVEIAWTVWDPFGSQVGTIAQSRPVAAGSLDTNWGLIANEAALAGAAGIAEMINRIDWSQGFQPPPG